MKKILFVDHEFHKKTKSSEFFVEILKTRFEVERFYLNPESDLDLRIISVSEATDVVVLWQMDFLAPVFIAQGKPTFVVPMYDGSNGMPELHWLAAHGARFLNFSMALHERIRMLGNQSLLLRYFPKPLGEGLLPRFDQLNGFFWQRRPDHGIDFAYVNTLIGHELDEFHVHKAADIEGDFEPRVPVDISYKYSSSSWFVDKLGYNSRLNKANVFVAPRVAEGIGIALLEAMARGMLVLAHDDATNNEYISSWINGILFNTHLPPNPIHIRSDAPALGRMAWKTVVEGHKKWIDSHDAILNWIDQDVICKKTSVDINHLLIDCWYSYYASLKEYSGFLHRNMSLLSKISNVPLSIMIEALHRNVDGARVDSSLVGRSLENNILNVGLSNNKHLGRGWSLEEGQQRWIEGVAADLRFSVIKPFSKRVRVKFLAFYMPSLGESLQCCISLNDIVVFDQKLQLGQLEYSFDVDASVLTIDNSMNILLGNASMLPGESRVLSAAFETFTFEQMPFP